MVRDRHRCDGAARLGIDRVEQRHALREIFFNMLRSGASHAVVASRSPRGQVMRALTEADRAYVVVRDDPRSALAHLVRGEGVGIASATRTIASACASTDCFSAMSRRACRKRGAVPRRSVGGGVAIARHLRLDLGDDEIAETAYREAASASPENTDALRLVGWAGPGPSSGS